MKIQGALVKEQGVNFAIVIVKSFVLQSTFEANKARQSFASLFPGLPIILMAQDGSGRPTYQGRTDIVNFLVNVPMSVIPWKEYSYN